MVVYLHEALEERMKQSAPLTETDLVQATITGAVQRLRPKLMTVTAVILSLAPILWESGIGSDVMKPIAAPIVGGMITSTIHVLILVPVFFLLMKRRDLLAGRLHPRSLQKTEVQSVIIAVQNKSIAFAAERYDCGLIPVTLKWVPRQDHIQRREDQP